MRKLHTNPLLRCEVTQNSKNFPLFIIVFVFRQLHIYYDLCFFFLAIPRIFTFLIVYMVASFTLLHFSFNYNSINFEITVIQFFVKYNWLFCGGGEGAYKIYQCNLLKINAVLFHLYHFIFCLVSKTFAIYVAYLYPKRRKLNYVVNFLRHHV